MFRIVISMFAALVAVLGLYPQYATAQAQAPAPLAQARSRALEDPRNAEAQLQLATVALRYHETAEALRAATTAVAIAPMSSAAKAALVTAQVHNGDYPDAIREFDALPAADQRALDKLIEGARQAQQAESLLADATNANNARRASQLLEQARASAPQVLRFRTSLGYVYLDRLHQPQQALPLLQSAYRDAPSNPDARKLLALAQLELDQYAAAAALYRDALSLEPDDVLLKVGLARALGGLRRINEARALLNEVLESEPDNEFAQDALEELQKGPDRVQPQDDVRNANAQELLRQARAATESNDFSKAAELLEQAVRLEPQSFTLHQTLGYLYLEKLRDSEHAYLHLRQADRLRPDNLDTLKLLGFAAFNIGENCEAIEIFQRVLARDPQDLYIKATLGRAYARDQQYHVALSILDAVLAADPGHFTARLGVAEVLAWKGRSNEPIAIASELVSEKPDSTEARTLLGDLYRWDYDFGWAQDEYNSALLYDPNAQAAHDGLYEIDKSLSYQVVGDGYQFVDNFDFDRRFAGASVRIPLTDKAYFIPRGVEWRYKQGGQALSRHDAIFDLEYHFNRQWQATGRFLNYDYTNRDVQHAGSISAQYTPLTATDFYFSASTNEPAYLTDFTIPLFNVRMNNFGFGYDIDLTDKISTQASASYSDYSDDNVRRFGSAQLSYKPWHCQDIFFRVQYEDLSFTDQTPLYFSPANFEIIRLINDVTYPVTPTVNFIGRFEALCQLAEGWGHHVKLGPQWVPSDWIELRASYFNTSVPGAAPFSGQGFDVFGSCRF